MGQFSSSQIAYRWVTVSVFLLPLAFGSGFAQDWYNRRTLSSMALHLNVIEQPSRRGDEVQRMTG